VRPGLFDSPGQGPACGRPAGRFGRVALDSAAMSRVISPLRRRARRAIATVASVGLLAAVVGVPVAAQDLPACSDGRLSDCVLADWSDAVQRDIPSLFGDIEAIVWVDDPNDDAPSGGLDILGVGLGRVDITAPAAVRESADLLRSGKPKKAVPKGSGVLVRIVLDRPIDQVEGGHSSVHVATDIKGSRSDNAPTGVAAPQNPFAGSGDVYSLTWASTTGQTKLLDSDLAKGWYKDKDPFAAAWAAPNVLDVLLAPQAFGDAFRVISHASGAEGGYDSVTLGPAAIPSDGQVGLIPVCLEGSISDQPFVVDRLVENAQTLRQVEAPASWRGGVGLPIDDDTRQALDALLVAADDDGDGRIGIDSTVSLFEDGVVIRQRPLVELALDGDRAQLALELGLTRRGYNVLRDIEVEPSGDERVDAWLARATDALTETMPPFRSARKPGLVAGAGIGACIPWLTPPEPSPEATPDASVEPSTDASADDPAQSA
jgi:hypothetical protein